MAEQFQEFRRVLSVPTSALDQSGERLLGQAERLLWRRFGIRLRPVAPPLCIEDHGRAIDLDRDQARG